MRVGAPVRSAAVLCALLCACPAVRAQRFKAWGRTVEVHGFFSQGFAYSDHNNYLSMQTSRGSFAFTDGGLNITARLTDRLWVGAQVYARNIGNLGEGRPQVDWAVADYKLKDWFGVRGGVVKTVFGLHNDTQDAEFLHTSAILPQSIYPIDLRDGLIRHRGGDLYGRIPLKRYGILAYTGFAGKRVDGTAGGYSYLLQRWGTYLRKYGGLQWGGDLRWHTPVMGLTVGASHMDEDIEGWGTARQRIYNFVPMAMREWSNKDQANQVYGQYTRDGLRVESEYRRWWRDQAALPEILTVPENVTIDSRGWYVLGSYRFSKRFELGGYYSRLVVTWRTTIPTVAPPPDSRQEDPNRHVYDRVVTARFDLHTHWNIKVEGHFMDGYGGLVIPAGFFAQENPQGFHRKTNLLLVRLGWSF
jgi:hypothetical protein